MRRERLEELMSKGAIVFVVIGAVLIALNIFGVIG